MAVIKLATIDNVADIAANNVAMGKETESLDIPADVAHQGVIGLLSNTDRGHYYVILGGGGEVIAQLMITYEWSDWRAAQLWWIQSVYVRPAHRRQGLFKQLYRHAREQAQAAGACGVRLYADNGNTNAHATYYAMGMKSHCMVFEDLFTSY